MDKNVRRQELLRAARDVFATKGFHDAKVDDIVAAASVAKGTFYLYFRDKRSVFAELVDSLFGRISAAILHVDTDADVETQVKHNIRAIVAVFMDDPALTKILLAYASGLDPAFGEKIRYFYDGATTLLREALEEGQRMGIVAQGDADLFARISIGALKELLAEEAAAQKPRSREELVEGLFGLLSRGYLRMDRIATPELDRAPVAEGVRAERGSRRRRRIRGAT